MAEAQAEAVSFRADDIIHETKVWPSILSSFQHYNQAVHKTDQTRSIWPQSDVGQVGQATNTRSHDHSVSLYVNTENYVLRAVLRFMFHFVSHTFDIISRFATSQHFLAVHFTGSFCSLSLSFFTISIQLKGTGITSFRSYCMCFACIFRGSSLFFVSWPFNRSGNFRVCIAVDQPGGSSNNLQSFCQCCCD